MRPIQGPQAHSARQCDQITKLAAEGKARGATAAQLEVGVASVYRVLWSAARG
jgi:hypothetical protein